VFFKGHYKNISLASFKSTLGRYGPYEIWPAQHDSNVRPTP